MNARSQLAKLVNDTDVYTTTLLTLALDRLGNDLFEWHPETVRLEMEQALGVRLQAHAFNRLMAGIALLSTDQFYSDLPKFIDICNVLSGDDFDPETFDPADTDEICWAVTEATLLDPPDEGVPKFTEEIKAYMAAVLSREGYATAPRVIAPILSGITLGDPGTFADDPEIFGAIHEAQQAKNEEINTMILDNLRELMAQLESLPLQNGTSREILQRLRGGLNSS